VFPASQLGNERELIEGVKIGTIQMAFVSGAISGFYKEAMVLDIPYLFANGPVAWTVMDGPFGAAMAADILQKTECVCLLMERRGSETSRTLKVHQIPCRYERAQNKGHGNPGLRQYGQGPCAAPTPIAWSEVYTALQQKVVDGQENPVADHRTGQVE